MAISGITYQPFAEEITGEEHAAAMTRLQWIAEEFDNAKLLDITDDQVQKLIDCAAEASYGSIKLTMGGWGTEIEGDKTPYIAYVTFQTYVLSLHLDHQGIEFGISQLASEVRREIHQWHRDNLENLDHD